MKKIFIVVLFVSFGVFADSFGGGSGDSGRTRCRTGQVSLSCKTNFKDAVIKISHDRLLFPGESGYPNCKLQPLLDLKISIKSSTHPDIDDMARAESFELSGSIDVTREGNEYHFEATKKRFFLKGLSLVTFAASNTAQGFVLYKNIDGVENKVKIQNCSRVRAI